VFVAFDVLAVDAHPVDHEPYREGRRRLEALDLRSPHVHLTSSHHDGPALWDPVIAEGLEGVVAKRVNQRTGLASRRGSHRLPAPGALAPHGVPVVRPLDPLGWPPGLEGAAGGSGRWVAPLGVTGLHRSVLLALFSRPNALALGSLRPPVLHSL
jgi:hypothetical protein